jgi:6-phosphogluconolactonase
MIKSQEAIVDVQADTPSVAERVARWLVEQLNTNSDKVSLCLSGGKTPKLLYEFLAKSEFANSIPWTKVHLFWGDERFVAKSDQLSNFKMVKTALLDHISIPEANIHAVPTELGNSDLSAVAYEKDLQNYYGGKALVPKRFLFDVVLLGIGGDGHTASLFPGNEVLNEKTAWVKAVKGAKPEDRITLTLPVLNSSKSVAFLVTGADKSAVMKEILGGKSTLPAGLIRPEGNLFWFLDQAAYL